MLIGLSYIFPVILKKKTLHNRHQPSQHRKPIIIPTSLRPTVESSVVDCRVPSVRSLFPPFRPFVRRPFVCSITDMNLAIIPRHSLWSLCCMLPVPPATCGLCPFFQFVTQLWQKRWRRRWSLLPPSTAVMGNKESNESAAVKRQAEGGANPMYELLDLSGTTIWLKKKRCLLFERWFVILFLGKLHQLFFFAIFELPTEFSCGFLPLASSISIFILAY